MGEWQENQTSFCGSCYSPFLPASSKKIAKSSPCGQNKSCHFDFSWMHNSKCSAKCRASLQLIPPTTLHCCRKAADILPNDNDFLATRKIGRSLVDTREPETGGPTNLVWIFAGGRGEVTSSGRLNPAISLLFQALHIQKRGVAQSCNKMQAKQRKRNHCFFFYYPPKLLQHGWLSHSWSVSQ